MTNEEIIEQLELCIGLIKQNGKDWLDERDVPVLEKAIDAIKRQIPKKTITPDSPFYRYACPKCGNYPLHGQYCDECGQMIVYDKEWMKDDN